MVKNFEKSQGQSSEWRTSHAILAKIGLKYAVDPCGPESGYYAVPAEKVLTVRDDGLVQPWGDGLAFVNPPWSTHRCAVVPWLERFFAHPGGGVLLCCARTSSSWWHQILLPRAELICFPTGKTRFFKPDGSPGPSPTNGIALIGRGAVACAALRGSGLGYCLVVDRSAATPATRLPTATPPGADERAGAIRGAAS